MRHIFARSGPLTAALLLAACPASDPPPDPPVDLTVALGEGEARAGVITQEAALLGGAAADSQLGDVLLYNGVARFVVQGLRDGGGLARQAGGVIDVDLARPEGQPGRDLVGDWMPMIDLGYLPLAETIEVVDDGLLSGTAHVRVTGSDSPLEYILGMFEDPGFLPELDLTIVTDFRLPADSPLMRVDTTVTVDEALTARFGDVINNAPGVGDPWLPGIGRSTGAASETDWLAYVDHEQGYTVGMFKDGDAITASNPGFDLLNALLSIVSLYQPSTTIEAGGSATYGRWYGVAADPAALTDAWLEARGVPTRTVTTTVQAPDGPVAGARVTALIDGLPFTLAFSDADGSVSLSVPAEGELTWVADGSGSRVIRDRPAGSARYGPMSGAVPRARALEAFTSGGVPVPHARGRGRAVGEPLDLGTPGLLRLEGDGRPFEARLSAVDDAPFNDAFGAPPQHSLAALAYPIDGSLDIPLEPGEYDLIAHRGGRWELHEARVTVEAGQTTTERVELTLAVETPGWWTADTHMHAWPSTDGKISMSDRLTVSAATGVELHVSTEHDALADYEPLVGPLGLEGLVGTVPGVEVSSIGRGHTNLFPVEPDPTAPSGGAWRWWLNIVGTTTEQFEALRAWHPNAVVQINHPFAPGMPTFANWVPGSIGRPDYWYDGFDALEIVKGNSHDDAFELYLDLIDRGIVPAAMGNTDSHTHLSNDPGMNVTYVGLDLDSPSAVTGDAFADAIRARRTVATNGPFIQLSIPPGTVLTEAAELEVEVLAPSWIVVDRIDLFSNGEIVDGVDGTTATFALTAEVDASFLVRATGSIGIGPIGGHEPWALTSPILLDLDGDGWDPPLPPLHLEGVD